MIHGCSSNQIDSGAPGDLILMTDGPEARVGEIYNVPFPRPRSRVEVMEDPNYFDAHNHVIDFLENHAKQFAA